MNATTRHSVNLGKISGFPRSWGAVLGGILHRNGFTAMKPARSGRSEEIELDGNELIRFEQADAVPRIQCVRGLLWITQEGDLHDHLLRKGETFAPRGKGVIVVQALRNSILSCQ